jgi:hypothetical protein
VPQSFAGPDVRTPVRGEEVGIVDGRLAYLAKPGEPTDWPGRPLGDNDDLRQIFATASTLLELLVRLDAQAGMLQKIWPQFRGPPIRTLLREGAELLGGAIPYCVCPSCSGVGRRRNDPCNVCHGGKVIARQEFQFLHPDLREVAHGYQ